MRPAIASVTAITSTIIRLAKGCRTSRPNDRPSRGADVPREPDRHRARRTNRRDGIGMPGYRHWSWPPWGSDLRSKLLRRTCLRPCCRRPPSSSMRRQPSLSIKRNVVARDQQRHADFIEAPEYTHDFERQVRVEVAGGLVRNQQLGPGHDRARDTDPLLLARGQGLRVPLLLVQQADLVERGTHSLGGFALTDAGDDQRQRDVVGDRAGRTAACGPGRPCRSGGGTWEFAAGGRGSCSGRRR